MERACERGGASCPGLRLEKGGCATVDDLERGKLHQTAQVYDMFSTTDRKPSDIPIIPTFMKCEKAMKLLRVGTVEKKHIKKQRKMEHEDIEARVLELELEAGMKLSEAATLRLEHPQIEHVRSSCFDESLSSTPPPLPSSLSSNRESLHSRSAAERGARSSLDPQPQPHAAQRPHTTSSAKESPHRDPNWLTRAEYRAQRGRARLVRSSCFDESLSSTLPSLPSSLSSNRESLHSRSAAERGARSSLDPQPQPHAAQRPHTTSSAKESPHRDPNWLTRAEYRAQRGRALNSIVEEQRQAQGPRRSQRGQRSLTATPSHSSLASLAPEAVSQNDPTGMANLHLELAAQLILSARRYQQPLQESPSGHPEALPTYIHPPSHHGGRGASRARGQQGPAGAGSYGK